MPAAPSNPGADRQAIVRTVARGLVRRIPDGLGPAPRSRRARARLGSCLAMVVSISAGFHVVLWTGAAIYAAAALLWPRAPTSHPGALVEAVEG